MISRTWVRILVGLRTFLIAALLALFLSWDLPVLAHTVGLVVLLVLMVAMFLIAKFRCGCPHCGCTGARLDLRWKAEGKIICPKCGKPIFFE